MFRVACVAVGRAHLADAPATGPLSFLMRRREETSHSWRRCPSCRVSNSFQKTVLKLYTLYNSVYSFSTIGSRPCGGRSASKAC